MKKILKHPYLIAGSIVFLLIFFIGIIWLDFTLAETLFASAALAVIGVGSIWWKAEVW